MKLKAIHHPVLGHLVPDQWGDTLMCFREIPELKRFTPSDRESTFKRLSHEDQQLVKDWPKTPEKLVKKCRDCEIFDSLRGLGVFEFAFKKTSTGEPSPEQVAGAQYFQDHRAQICENLAAAMLRYYCVARAEDEHWFDNFSCPALNSVEELGPLVPLDGITVTTRYCEGLPVLTIGWKPDWDMEHGLNMALWKNQVIGINFEDLFELASSSESAYCLWNRSRMTPAERDALDQVAECLDDEEDEE